MNSSRLLIELLAESLDGLDRGFAHLRAAAGSFDQAKAQQVLGETAARLQDNLPYHHPLYAGQMLKPPHPVAQAAYALAMSLNPNNHALDGGRASSAMEQEAVAQIASMFGWQDCLGHLCGGGTIANFEALWIARERRRGTTLVASTQAHYTHSRLSSVLGVEFEPVEVDRRGRLDVAALETILSTGEVGAVVATLGTTAAGAVDALDEIAALRSRYDFHLHVDAAYGGYFTLVDNLDESARRAFDALPTADSIVIDPHKHGLQPYGCGCILFRDPSVAQYYQHECPYAYFTSDDLHLGEVSLECSRPGAAAVALWATMLLLPLERGGEFASGLESSRSAALKLYDLLLADDRFVPLFKPELDVVVWAVRASSAAESSSAARRIFDLAAERDLHLALVEMPRQLVEATGAVADWDADEVTCLRSCLMKPEHIEWLPEIWSRLDAAAWGPAAR